MDLLKFIWNLAPTYVITRNAIGSIHKASEYIAKNFKEFYYDGLIEDFFLKEKPITDSHFTINSNKDSYQYQNFSTLVDGLISYLIESKKIEEIEQLIYLLDEYEFNEERPWGKRLEILNNHVMETFAEIPNFKEFLVAGKNMLELSVKLPQKTVKTKKQKI